MSRKSGQPRTRCRLPCIVRAGRGRVRARVLDISSGGLCFVAPVAFRQHARVRVEIVVPRRGPVAVEGDVRHRRPFRQPSSGRRGWATGMAIATASPDFLALTRSTVLAESSGEPVVEASLECAPIASPDASHAFEPDLVVEEQALYRIRLKAVGSSRTRTLSLRGVSESAVCEAVLRDLPGDWEVLGIEVDPID